jgi:hypothetical protein
MRTKSDFAARRNKVEKAAIEKNMFYIGQRVRQKGISMHPIFDPFLTF